MFEVLARGRQDSGVTIKLLKIDGTITECDVSLNAYREFIRLLYGKYQVASSAERSRILNAIVLARGCHRKTAIRLMTAKTPPGLRRGSGSRLGGYSEECKRVLKDLWHRMGRMSGRKMKAALPDWLPHCPFPIERGVWNELHRVSATTIDRWMKPERARLNRAAQSQTRPPKKECLIPLKPLGHVPDAPGFLEVDTVSHGGGHASGVYANTVTMTDLFSSWTLNRAVLGKGGEEVAEALIAMVESVPFPVSYLCFDNGSEFLNDAVWSVFQERRPEIKLVRGRPYHKNDQCYVEQKNFTSVRQLFGYERIEGKRAVEQMNEIYDKVWNPLHNHYIPQDKTVSKTRIGSHYRRKFRGPQTPHDVLLEGNHLTETQKGRLMEEKLSMNPFHIGITLRRYIRRFSHLTERHWSVWPARYSHA